MRVLVLFTLGLLSCPQSAFATSLLLVGWDGETSVLSSLGVEPARTNRMLDLPGLSGLTSIAHDPVANTIFRFAADGAGGVLQSVDVTSLTIQDEIIDTDFVEARELQYVPGWGLYFLGSRGGGSGEFIAKINRATRRTEDIVEFPATTALSQLAFDGPSGILFRYAGQSGSNAVLWSVDLAARNATSTAISTNLGDPQSLEFDTSRGVHVLSFRSSTPVLARVNEGAGRNDDVATFPSSSFLEETAHDFVTGDTYRFESGSSGGGASGVLWSIDLASGNAVSTAIETDIEEPQALFTLFQPVQVMRRGDCNSDGDVDISDGVFELLALFLSGAQPICPEACELNGDSMFDVSDTILLFGSLFLGQTPPIPQRVCRPDPDLANSLGCPLDTCQ